MPPIEPLRSTNREGMNRDKNLSNGIAPHGMIPPVPVGNPLSNQSDSPESDDEYDLSDVDDRDVLGDCETRRRPSLKGLNPLSENASRMSSDLCQALDSSELNKSLALQANTSGYLTNEACKLSEKLAELQECQKKLKGLYNDMFTRQVHFDSKQKLSKVEKIQNDFSALEKRLNRLLHGQKSLGLSRVLGIGHEQIGVAALFPVEFNRARDKVMERSLSTE